ncbi:MAG: GPR endopeptidase [Bacillota bacterium]|uniref:GPR endopeptidase n=1 Tax=Desulfurispora thermophila TaxID=265470 RepID=UPI0003709B37|nr:GPR endopeptidase [Desulfurispora thermophila]
MQNIWQAMNIHVDLALEAREIVQGKTGQEIPGVRVDREKFNHATVTIVHIEDPGAEQIMGKPVGTYITIEAPVLRHNDPIAHHEVGEIVARQLSKVLNLADNASVLVVGLGNWHATPDALGPKVVDMTMVTRHIFNYAPQELAPGMRPVSALAPGVLGITGIETAEIIRGVVEKIQPDLVIAIDALASRNVDRIATTIQIADTGVSPGSGVGNQRQGLNKQTLGIPVVAIGVPTVVHAAVIANDTIEEFIEQIKNSPSVYKVFSTLNLDITRTVIEKVLEPFGGHLMVTPKEIDDLIQRTAKVIAGGITRALHPQMPVEQYEYYLQ